MPHTSLAGPDPVEVGLASTLCCGALEAPIRQIVENAGAEGSVVVGKINENKSQTYGFDAQTEQYVDMLSAGIVDPAKVVRVALQDAASIAGLMITTKAMVAEAPKKKEAAAMPGGAWAVWAAWTIDRLTRTNPGPPRCGPGIDHTPMPGERLIVTRISAASHDD